MSEVLTTPAGNPATDKKAPSVPPIQAGSGKPHASPATNAKAAEYAGHSESATAQHKFSPAAQTSTKKPERSEAEILADQHQKRMEYLAKGSTRRRRKGSPPLRSELMAAAAKAGDIEGVFEHWIVAEGDRDLRLVMPHVRDAMRNLANRDPKHLIQYAFNRMLVTQVDLMMRVERRIHNEIETYDNFRPDSGLPPEVTKEWLPRLERIQETIQQTSKSMASTLHALSLAQDGTKLERQKGANVVPLRPQNDGEYANTAAV